MATATQKITLSASRDIPFNKLVLSQSNVRRLKAGVSIEELAEDIARRGLLQSLNVRPVLDAEGKETGMFEIPAGGRRYRALELLAKKKRLTRTAPVPCIVREAGSDISAEEDSLAENVQRAPLHPLDQFRAFQTLREQGLTEEAIAARFFVSVNIVKQRLKLVTVSETLLDLYAEDGMTLEQLMAFTVSADHARQEQVWESIQHGWSKEPYQIRRMLTENTVRAADRRVRFVTIEAYEEAGGTVMRDLFQDDDGGWVENVPLLERLVADKLKAEAETIAGEGWKWIEVAADFPYGHTQGLTVSNPNMPKPTNCPTRWMNGSVRSRRHSTRSRTGRSISILPRSAVPACSSASVMMAASASIAAMSGPTTKPRRAATPALAAMTAKRRAVTVNARSFRSAASLSRRMTRTMWSSRCPSGW